MADRSPYAREEIFVRVAGTDVQIPYAPAAVWIEALTTDSGTAPLVTVLASQQDSDLILSRVLAGRISWDDVQRASYELLKEASPFKWWKTARLLAAAGRPDFVGLLLTHGVDPWNRSAAEVACVVYSLLTRNTDAKGKFKIDAQVDDPPPGIVDDEWMSESDFAAMVAQARNAPGTT